MRARSRSADSNAGDPIRRQKTTLRRYFPQAMLDEPSSDSVILMSRSTDMGSRPSIVPAAVRSTPGQHMPDYLSVGDRQERKHIRRSFTKRFEDVCLAGLTEGESVNCLNCEDIGSLFTVDLDRVALMLRRSGQMSLAS